MRGSGQEDQVAIGLLGDLANEGMALLLIGVSLGSIRRPVRFIDDDEIRAIEQEQMFVPVALEEVDARDLNGIILVDAVGSGLPPFEGGRRCRTE